MIPKDIHTKLILYSKSQIVYRIFFTSKVLKKRCCKYVQKPVKRTFFNQSDSAVCIPLRSQALPCAHCGVKVTKFLKNTKTRKTDIFLSVWLHGVLPNAESDTVICITVCFLPRSQAHCRIKIQIFTSLCVPLKGTILRNPFRGSVTFFIHSFLIWSIFIGNKIYTNKIYMVNFYT